ncbi:MAG: AAA family ATPase [bacterium]
MKTKKQNIPPLAWRLVPETLAGFHGQENLFGRGAPLRKMVESGKFISSLLYGPPGSGKTAFSRFIAENLNYKLVFVNAVNSDVARMRQILNAAEFEKEAVKTLLVVDEIEHFNRTQQNIFLPCVERGDIDLIGISFENPYYRMNTALLSRLKVFEFQELTERSCGRILEHALSSDKGFGGRLKISSSAKKILAAASAGDARRLLNFLELLNLAFPGKEIKEKEVRKVLEKGRKFDKSDHYDMISAFIKSVRGSDADSALYWLACMLKGGEDPRFIVRRLLILASEDIGNADPDALVLVAASASAVEFVGMPEARIILSQATIYCAKTFKSNSCYEAISKAENLCENKQPEVPAHLTKRGASLYKYPHSSGGWVDQRYSFIKERIYRTPSADGFEKELERRHNIVKGRTPEKNPAGKAET